MRRTVETVWRIESAPLLGRLVQMLGDVSLAEDVAQETLLAALTAWPEAGVPDKPAAWLMTTAKNRAIDELRRRRLHDRKLERLGAAYDANDHAEDVLDSGRDEDVEDDLLRLVLIACHPILSADSRAALTLKLLAGLTTAEIARAFLASEATIAQRIVRAKRTLAEAKVSTDVPHGAELVARLPSVFEVVYLIFNEGYVATRGESWMRQELCDIALRLGRSLAALVPDEAESHGLLALMELHASRAPARQETDGTPVRLADQNRARWDHLLIHRGLAGLKRAEALSRQPGPYTLQAAIAACHARAVTAEQTDWVRIAALYEALARQTPSPVVELNRAVAVSMAFGPAAALRLVEELANEPVLANHHHLPAVRPIY